MPPALSEAEGAGISLRLRNAPETYVSCGGCALQTRLFRKPRLSLCLQLDLLVQARPHCFGQANRVFNSWNSTNYLLNYSCSSLNWNANALCRGYCK